MSSFETQSIELETPSLSFGTPSRTSNPKSDSSVPSLSSASFVRSPKSRVVPSTLIGISEEVVLPKFDKMTPTMKVMGKGKGMEVNTFTQYEAFSQLIDTSIPTKEFKIGILFP